MKTDDNRLTEKRFSELADRARMSFTFQYTEFHSPAGAAIAYSVAAENEIKMWGGADGCERVVVRFGDESEIGYDEEFPIKLLIVKPKAPKFADKLTHRDFLGAIMNLGIERDTVGDIILRDNIAYVFVLESIADFIMDSLDRVKHTNVACEISYEIPEEVKPKLKPKEITVSSERFDAVVAKLFGLSRSEAKALFDKEAVFSNGKPIVNPSKIPEADSVVSVRGHGKFVFKGLINETKKGRLRVLAEVYL